MTPEEVVIERLASISALATLVSTRIFNLKVRQKPTGDYVRVQHISHLEPYHLRGSVSLQRTRVQVDACASESGDPVLRATRIAAVINGDGNGEDATGLSGWIGDGGGSPPTIRVSAIFKVDSGIDYDPDELRLVTVRQDYMVHWRPM